MKEKTTPKTSPPRKVKGTVLFTVVCVMMVLIVCLMGTLALAATANNRAMNTYSTAQTQATAKAGVNAIISAMQNNKDVAIAAAGVSAANPKEVVSNINIEYIGTDADGNSAMATATELGRITDASIEYAGEKYILDSEGNPVAKTVIKVSATATQGTASSTHTAYILRDVDSEDDDEGENQGFVATGSATSGNHTSVYGGAYIGFDDQFRNPANWIHPNTYTTYSAKDAKTVYETDFQVNGNFENDTATDMYLIVKSLKSGMTVWGDLTLNHPLYIDTTNATSAAYSSTTNYTDVPYIYVDGDLHLKAANPVIGPEGATPGKEVPLNIFCNNIVDDYGSAHALNIKADIYCYGTGTTDLKSPSSTTLYKWAADMVEPGGTGATNHVGGGFYSKGSLELAGTCTFNGDICVDGDLILNGATLKVEGDIKVGGTFKANNCNVTVANGKTVTAGGAVATANVKYANGSAVTIAQTNPNAVQRLKAGYTKEEGLCVFAEFNYNNSGNKYYWMKPEWSYLTSTGQWGVLGDRFPELLVVQEPDQGLRLNPDPNVPSGYRRTNGEEYPVDAVPKYSVYKDPGGVEVSEDEATEWIDSVTNLPIAHAKMFPDAYEKDVILGKLNPDGSPATTKDYKIITTVPEILANTSDPYHTEYTVPSTAAEACSTKILNLNSSGAEAGYWTKVGNPPVYTVTNSCTITGNVSDQTSVVIKAPASGTEIWVVLDSVSVSGGCFVVDDTTSAGKVNLLVKGNCTFSGSPTPSDNANIVLSDGNRWPSNSYSFLSTATIAKPLSTSGGTYQIYTSESLAMKDGDGNLLYPKVNVPVLNIYSEKGAPGSTDAAATLTVNNNTTATANIKAPYLDFNQASMGGATPACTLYYNGYNIADAPATNIGCIGCMICHEFSAGNNWMLLYSGSGGGNSTTPTYEDAIMTQWQVLYYENF